MERTQIYLRKSQKKALGDLAERQGKALAEVIREAVDIYIVENKSAPLDILEQTSGLWSRRDDINSGVYLERLRSETNNRLKGL